MNIDLPLLVMMLRVLLDDLDGTSYDYSDEKLTKLLATAAHLVLTEITFNTTYTLTIDFHTPSFDIDPAPTDACLSLIVLKAACLTDHSLARDSAITDGIKAQCGPAVMQNTSGGRAFEMLLVQGPCKTYEDLKHKVSFADVVTAGGYFKAVMGPFISNTYQCPSCSGYGWRGNSGCGSCGYGC